MISAYDRGSERPDGRRDYHILYVERGICHVYMDGVWLTEIILNVYEDLSEEGERRFLLDCTKPAPKDMLDQDVALTSHGNFVLDIERMG